SVRVSRSLRDIAYKALKARDELVLRNVKEPTITEISKELGLPSEEVVFALEAIQDPVSLFEPIYHDNGDAIFIMDQVQDEKNKDEKWIENIAVKEAVKGLNSREKMIIKMRYFDGKT